MEMPLSPPLSKSERRIFSGTLVGGVTAGLLRALLLNHLVADDVNAGIQALICFAFVIGGGLAGAALAKTVNSVCYREKAEGSNPPSSEYCC